MLSLSAKMAFCRLLKSCWGSCSACDSHKRVTTWLFVCLVTVDSGWLIVNSLAKHVFWTLEMHWVDPANVRSSFTETEKQAMRSQDELRQICFMLCINLLSIWNAMINWNDLHSAFVVSCAFSCLTLTMPKSKPFSIVQICCSVGQMEVGVTQCLSLEGETRWCADNSQRRAYHSIQKCLMPNLHCNHLHGFDWTTTTNVLQMRAAKNSCFGGLLPVTHWPWHLSQDGVRIILLWQEVSAKVLCNKPSGFVLSRRPVNRLSLLPTGTQDIIVTLNAFNDNQPRTSKKRDLANAEESVNQCESSIHQPLSRCFEIDGVRAILAHLHYPATWIRDCPANRCSPGVTGCRFYQRKLVLLHVLATRSNETYCNITSS